jgi:hypothetical protein
VEFGGFGEWRGARGAIYNDAGVRCRVGRDDALRELWTEGRQGCTRYEVESLIRVVITGTT